MSRHKNDPCYGLTPFLSEQIEKIKEIKDLSPKTIPAVSNEIAGLDQTVSPEERLQREYKKVELADGFKEGKYYAVLSPSQSNRLQQIMLQVRGLKMAATKPLVAASLNVSANQSNRFNQIITNYDSKLDPLYHRAHRQSISGLSPGESVEKRSSEISNLLDSICSIEMAREKEMSAILTPAQESIWLKLKGVPLAIRWSYNDFVDFSE